MMLPQKYSEQLISSLRAQEELPRAISSVRTTTTCSTAGSSTTTGRSDAKNAAFYLETALGYCASNQAWVRGEQSILGPLSIGLTKARMQMLDALVTTNLSFKGSFVRCTATAAPTALAALQKICDELASSP